MFIELITLRFESYVSNTELVELLYISIEVRPEVIITIANKFQCFVLTGVASKNMIINILENTCIKITSK